MIKGKDLIGLKVVSINNGKELGKVKDLIYDPASHMVRAVLVDVGGLLNHDKILMIDDIHGVGKDAVTIMNSQAVRESKQVPKDIEAIGKQNLYLTRTKIMTENGTELGKVEDILFDPGSGKVEELLVTQGLKDLQSGKKRVRVGDIMTVGEDTTVVRNYTEDRFAEQEQHQGVQGAVNQVKQQAADAGEMMRQDAADTNRKVQARIETFRNDPENKERMEQLGDKLETAGEKVKDTLAEVKDALEEKRDDFAQRADDYRQIKAREEMQAAPPVVPMVVEENQPQEVVAKSGEANRKQDIYVSDQPVSMTVEEKPKEEVAKPERDIDK